MFKDKIFKLYLSKAKVSFIDGSNNKPLPLDEEIGNWAQPIISHNKNVPDFFIRGNYQKINKSMAHKFTISPNGPHVLFITGTPLKNTDLETFRFKDRLFSSYYEDEIKGCYFQVLPVKEAYLGESKSLGVKQFKLS